MVRHIKLFLGVVAACAFAPAAFATIIIIDLTPLTNTDPVGGNHTVTAFLEGNGTPLPGATVEFNILSGPNAGATGSGVTGADGLTTFTYADNGGAGMDAIRASVGAIFSNQVTETWVAAGVVPEPATLSLLGIGLAGLGFWRRKQ